MIRYNVTVREVHTAIYVVDADSPEDAKNAVAQGRGVLADNSLEFVGLIDRDSWVAEEGSPGESMHPADAAFCDGYGEDDDDIPPGLARCPFCSAIAYPDVIQRRECCPRADEEERAIKEDQPILPKGALAEADITLVRAMDVLTCRSILSGAGVMTYSDQSDTVVRNKLLEYVAMGEIAVEQVRAEAKKNQ